ncbi:HigA family addiction module antitoxin [Magnetospirillum sp. 64-120]|uniref:HigA family addiction module antitoxin n=1 Tax=Magnetospirillum sp. 64-120 TaxID=1895778 RepID=UPI0025C5437A|nr:HigA family addiction module antitoxin [Magnetospirillum sp. 64-120]
MIASFSHAGLWSLYATGRAATLQTEEDRRCVAILDLLAALPPDEALPDWLNPACVLGEAEHYCVTVSNGLRLAFSRQDGQVSQVRLISSAFERPGMTRVAPDYLERRPTQPGAIFRMLFLPATGLSPAHAARHLGVSHSSLNKFFGGDRRAVGDLALSLAELTGTSTVFWTRLQNAHDITPHRRSVVRGVPLSAIQTSIEAPPSLRRGRRIPARVPMAATA